MPFVPLPLVTIISSTPHLLRKEPVEGDWQLKIGPRVQRSATGLQLQNDPAQTQARAVETPR